MNEAMNNAVNELLANIKQDYIKFFTAGGKEISSYGQQKIAAFEDETEVKVGSKYIKIIRDNSVWGFIVNTENDKKFKVGDILKAAGYNAPARNAARGNILEGGYRIQWTGPLYL